MLFEEALKEMRNGKKVYHKCLIMKKDDIFEIKDGSIKNQDGEYLGDKVSSSCMLTDSWHIYEEKKETEYFDIGEAIKRLKQGKKISHKYWRFPGGYIIIPNFSLPTSLHQIIIRDDHYIYEGWEPTSNDLLSEEYYEVEE